MINSIEYNDLTFNIIEEKISNFLYEIGVNILQKILENIDEEIFNTRNKKIYRYKDKRERTINTNFGSITYKRRCYIEKINTSKYISSLDFQYNGILCSALNKNISFRHSFVDESKHILSNFNRNQGNMTKEFCHIYNLTDKTPQDILLLDHFNSIELYNKLGITNKISNTIDQTINDDSISYNSLINTSQIYLTASTYFDFNKTNIKNCSRTILQDIK